MSQVIPELGPNSISITYTNGQRACTSSGSNIIKIQFLTNFGP
jgi:hypothetical protein